MSFLTAAFPVLTQIAQNIAAKFFPNPEDELKKLQLAQEIPLALLASQDKIDEAASDVVKTEAASSHWLAANWRPITALVFVGLIVARWFGWTAPNMSESEYLSVYDLIKIMIGGYVISRGVEKVAPTIAGAIGGGK